MKLSNPHVAVVVNKTNKAMNLLACLWFHNVLNCFDLLASRYDTTAVDHIAQIFQFRVHKETFLGIDL